MAENVVYGVGGYDPSKPDDNVVFRESVPDPPAPPDVDALKAKLAKATTTAGLKAVLGDVLDALDQQP